MLTGSVLRSVPTHRSVGPSPRVKSCCGPLAVKINWPKLSHGWVGAATLLITLCQTLTSQRRRSVLKSTGYLLQLTVRGQLSASAKSRCRSWIELWESKLKCNQGATEPAKWVTISGDNHQPRVRIAARQRRRRVF